MKPATASYSKFRQRTPVRVKKFNVIFIFETEDALNKFVNSGWEMGAKADAAATASEGKGGGLAGAVSVSDGV